MVDIDIGFGGVVVEVGGIVGNVIVGLIKFY